MKLTPCFYIPLIAVAVQLSGCAAQKIVAPGAAALNDASCAYFRTDKKSGDRGLWSELNAVYPNEGGTLIRSESFKDYSEIKVVPGIYRVQLKVRSDGYAATFPIAHVDAKPGKTYFFASTVVMNGKAVRANYKEVDTSSVPAQEK